ncbi:MAG: aconitate hydratase AcnA [Alcaligenaceae bacterium]|nr:MAG: aconitate hydratase AcnA [Alcaligenaceae bacterium]
MSKQFQASQLRRTLEVNGKQYDYFSLNAAQQAGLLHVDTLPYTLRILLENLLRAQGLNDSDHTTDVRALVSQLIAQQADCVIEFRPARVMMPESSGLTLMGDLAAMRDAMTALGGDAALINPSVAMDFIVDHSVMVEDAGKPTSLEYNMAAEFAQNRERYEFLRWCSQAFDGVRVFPPGSGILHQVNLEFLARVVWTKEHEGRTLAFPDSLIGMDSHTAMINALGVVAWGVGGFEGGAVALGEPVSVPIPEVVGCQLTGALQPGVTSTDLVLTITQRLRGEDVIGRFIEYFGSGVDALSLPERATVSNMTPECGATMSFFPVDQETLRYLEVTGRSPEQVALVKAYCQVQGLWRDSKTVTPRYARVINIDLSTVVPSMAGPGRPDARVDLSDVAQAFHQAVVLKTPKTVATSVSDIGDGSVVIAAITSCTNTSNPGVMIGAGLLARNARRRGLKPKPWVKTSLSPGSRVVADYLNASGLQGDLDALGFNVVGFGCMSCMGNSGPLPDAILKAIDTEQLATVAVLSGNRNFDARVHNSVQVNFLASPPLVIAYALTGSIQTNLTQEPLGHDQQGVPVYLRDIWPDPDEIRAMIARHVEPHLYQARYRTIFEGSPQWRALTSATGKIYDWNPTSSFIVRPPYFEGMTRAVPAQDNIIGARVLGMFGDMLTTDHISPIGKFSVQTPAGQYLQSLGVDAADFVNYGARRLNHQVMMRGTFANVRLSNELTPGVQGSSTLHLPSKEVMSIYAAAQRYRAEGVALVVVAGKEYGAGSSRDWAAKGTGLLGVRAVIAESLERIHRSNLVSMGVLPLQFLNGDTRQSLGLTGAETFDILGLNHGLGARDQVDCMIRYSDGHAQTIRLLARLDSDVEAEYYRHGGILQYVLRNRLIHAPG